MASAKWTRRQFLWTTAAATTGLALGCGPGPAGGVQPTPRGAGEKTLRILQWSHFVPAYDKWFDETYVKQWGNKNDVEVTVDHVSVNDLPARAAAEVAAQAGHDLFGFLSPPPSYEDQVIDHTEIVQQVERKLGKMIGLAHRSTYNPKTKKYFGFSDNWVPDPMHYRKDLWEQIEPGLKPDTWEAVLKAAPKLKALGHPIGLGMSNELDSNMLLIAMLQTYGAYIQDDKANVTINSNGTVEAVKMMAEIYKQGMTPEVFAWDPSSNNRLLTSGKGSLILNAISALRTAEKATPELGKNIWLAPIPKGPVQQLGLEHVMGVYSIWKFAKSKERAKQFLVDLALSYRDAFVHSEFYNFPSWPGAVADLKQMVSNDPVSQPSNKLAVLADAEKWSTNVGHPGFSNAAVDEVFNQFLIPQMFAQVARGQMTAAESVKWAEGQIKPIFKKWKDQGKI